MTQATLDVVLEDFGDFSKKIFEYVKKKGYKLFKKGDESIIGGWTYRVAVNKNGIAWYGSGEGYDETPIGKPSDYPPIRDDPVKLQEFIAKLLDRGMVHYGGGHCDGYTNPAEYVTWLYSKSQHLPFKRNLETVVVDLLKDELGREFTPLNYEGVLAKELEDFARFFEGDIDKEGDMKFGGDSLQGAKSRAGFGDGLDEKFKDIFEREMGRTEREMTFEEFYDRWGGKTDVEKMKVAFARYNPPLKVVHFSETTKEFKEEFKQKYSEKEAKRKAVLYFAPQFDRLIGLLNVVCLAGNKNNGFAKAYDALEQKAKDEWMKDAPKLPYEYGPADNMYANILGALGSIQPDTKLREFWVDKITDAKSKVGGSALYGLLRTYDDKTEARKAVAELIKKLRKEGFDRKRLRTYGMYSSSYEPSDYQWDSGSWEEE